MSVQSDEQAILRAFRLRRAETGSEDIALLELFEKGRSHGIRHACQSCDGDCLQPIRARYDHLLKARG